LIFEVQTKLLFTIILILITGLSDLYAQQQGENPFKAWIKLEKVKDSTLVKAILVNESKVELPVHYYLSIQKGRNTKDKLILKEGNFISYSKQTIPITQTMLSLNATDHYKLLLSIYHKHLFVSADSIVNENALAIVKVPKAKEATIKTNSKKQQASKKQDIVASASELEIDGLIIDETRSKIGRDFYDLFYNKWSAPSNAKDFIITIKELPSRGRMTRVSILINDTQLFTRVLQPRHDIIENLANQSVIAAGRFLRKDSNLKQQLEDPDQAGSGIF